MTDHPIPISLNERERFMDALRGFAILGIFIANLVGLSLYDPSDTSRGLHFGEFDGHMLFLQHMFIEGKFYSIFSLLFGWGLALQIKRTQKDSATKVNPVIIRRLLFMLLIGIIHLAVIWNGDIITLYALVAFVLLFFRNVAPRRLLIIGIFLTFVPVLSYWLRMQTPMLNKPAEFFYSVCTNLDSKLLGISTPGDFANLIKRGSLKELIIYNFDGAFYRFGDLIFQSRMAKVLAMFLIGYALGISGFYKVITNRPKLLLMIGAACLAVALPANFLMANFMETPANYHQFKSEGLYQTIVYAIGVAPLAIAYISILALIFRSRIGNRILTSLMPVGRMALTNYIGHSLVCIVIFYGIGFGLMGTMGPIAWTIFAVAVFIIQIVFSAIWLQYFYFGPLEWMWRSLTYGKVQPFRREKFLLDGTA